MKNASLAVLSVLLAFLCVSIGVLIGRLSDNGKTLIAYERNPSNQYGTEVTASVDGVPQNSELGKVDLNTATVNQLISLPGIGETIALRIIAYRTENGPFSSVDELVSVEGIGPSKLEKIYDQVTVGG